MSRLLPVILATASVVAAPTLAETVPADTVAPADAPGAVPAEAPDARPVEGAIVVTGVRKTGADVLGSVSVVAKEELQREVRPSIGETLAAQPGVSASSFGPTASRPILRGLSGERVRVLVDGIGSLDLSSSDPDHAVAINPLTAERIEVLRGPSSLLYGSSAIGGVVDVVDTRIPREAPNGGFSADFLGVLGSAADERSINGAVNVGLTPQLVGHLDASWSKYEDLRTGGHILAKPLRRQAALSPDPAIRALADLKGKLPNSAGELGDIAAGIAYVDGPLNVGVSLAHHDARYGVPIRYSLDPAVEAEEPTIDASQDRADARAEVPLGGLFRAINFRGGIARYHHNELEKDGNVGSSFFSNGLESRLELVQSDRSGWGGTSGVQFLRQSARIVGSEKYLPDSHNRQLGLFTLQTYVAGPLRLEGGLRVESVRVEADADPVLAAEPDGDPRLGGQPLTRKFTPVSGSIGGNYEVGGGWRTGLSLSHSERAPSIDELFSKGPHGGSQSFVVGDPDLGIEKSNSIELTLAHNGGPLHLQGSVYYSRFGNFLYQAPTGEIADGLPLYEYFQGKARYYGFEGEAGLQLGQALGIRWGSELVADAVRARIDGVGPAPQIPPFRVLGALTGERGPLAGRLEVERVSAQHRIAANETPTPGFTMVNASLDWHPLTDRPNVTLSLQGNNLFDVEARRASSQLKDYAPLAGRDIRLSVRAGF